MHKSIVQGLRAHGVAVADMPDPGDVLCYYNGVFLPIEFKSDKKTRGYKTEATPLQAQRAVTMPIPLAHSLTEALAWLGIKEKISNGMAEKESREDRVASGNHR